MYTHIHRNTGTLFAPASAARHARSHESRWLGSGMSARTLAVVLEFAELPKLCPEVAIALAQLDADGARRLVFGPAHGDAYGHVFRHVCRHV